MMSFRARQARAPFPQPCPRQARGKGSQLSYTPCLNAVAGPPGGCVWQNAPQCRAALKCPRSVQTACLSPGDPLHNLVIEIVEASSVERVLAGLKRAAQDGLKKSIVAYLQDGRVFLATKTLENYVYRLFGDSALQVSIEQADKFYSDVANRLAVMFTVSANQLAAKGKDSSDQAPGTKTATVSRFFGLRSQKWHGPEAAVQPPQYPSSKADMPPPGNSASMRAVAGTEDPEDRQVLLEDAVEALEDATTPKKRGTGVRKPVYTDPPASQDSRKTSSMKLSEIISQDDLRQSQARENLNKAVNPDAVVYLNLIDGRVLIIEEHKLPATMRLCQGVEKLEYIAQNGEKKSISVMSQYAVPGLLEDGAQLTEATLRKLKQNVVKIMESVQDGWDDDADEHSEESKAARASEIAARSSIYQTLTYAMESNARYAVLTDSFIYIFMRPTPVMKGGAFDSIDLEYYVAFSCGALPGEPTAPQVYEWLVAKQDHPDWKLNVKEFAEGGRAPTVKELRAKQPQPGSPAQKDLELKEGIQSLMAGIVSLNDLGPKIGNGADGHVFSIYDHVAVKVTHINTIKHEADMYAACETHGLSGPQGAVPTFYGYGKLNHGELKDSKLGWLAVEKIKVVPVEELADVEQAIDGLLEACSALEDWGIMHGDVKWGNAGFNRVGKVQLFDLARTRYVACGEDDCVYDALERINWGQCVETIAQMRDADKQKQTTSAVDPAPAELVAA